MHLMIPYASAAGEAGEAALQTLALPRLSSLLSLLQPDGPALGGDELSLATPFELALQAAGRPVNAAAAALADGIEVGGDCWALLSPMHLSVSSDQVLALDPQALQLNEADSRQLLSDLAAELFPTAEGWRHAFGAPERWYIAHPDLQGLASASLERVINRPVDTWMPEARKLRTLQNECQMLLHRHPLNGQREARGELVVNSVWISGCGRFEPAHEAAGLQIESRLREPLLAGDWAAWCDAWRALDAGLIAELLSRAKQGEPDLQLTLCGDREARPYRLQPRSAWQRLWQSISAPRVDAMQILGAL
ncbi:hypothetical protein J7U46_14020 [Pelomonas sp. V22]|uniref:hypothetical protein n=1 Tax=Pelomonas sp. V22 TaxID=2822139 RepID=UPI0024A9B430|nr:hypothetical protein [Pelomonas sp. V22]MDI4634170.1 hypothetical protein [Pelomonas sp. V22]